MPSLPTVCEIVRGARVCDVRAMDRSICSQLVALRRRNTEIIFHIGDLLRGDAGDMVRKGVGWLLKETYPKKPLETIEFLDVWRPGAPRLVLRIAAEKMTEKDWRWLLTG